MVQRKNLELSVTDFGPIAKAEIDLRPLIVFVGPSNTGKSYLAILIYALHKFFFAHINIFNFDPDGVREEHIGDLIEWIDEISSQLDAANIFSEVTRVTAPDSINCLIGHYRRGTEKSGNILHDEISRCFGIGDIGRLIRHPGRGRVSVSLKRNFSDWSEPTEHFEYKSVMDQKGAKFTTSIPDNTSLLFERIGIETTILLKQFALGVRSTMNQIEFSIDTEHQKYFVVNGLVDLAASFIYHPLNRIAHYLPADRAGVMHSYRAAVSSLIERAAYPWIPSTETSAVLSGVVADFLRQLNELDLRAYAWGRISEDEEDGAELAARIERHVLKGAALFERSAVGYPASYPILSYRKDTLEGSKCH